MDFAELDFNEEFVSAFEALENTGLHLYVTGKAGTGKSTLLQYFREKTAKNVAVLAPTGVAAINIKGQTIHSFFGFKPDITPATVGDIPIRKRRRKIFEELDALIIDEVSMVRADLMDCIDVFLRLYGPDYDRPFGGIQMIFFGDLFQLPPVVGRGEEDIFKTHYPTPYFFSAKVFESLDFKIMQLKKIYRQKDEHFIRILNAVRDDMVEHHHWQALNDRFKPNHRFLPQDFYIVLTSTNALAEKVNNQHLQGLNGIPKTYQGIVSGEFERKSLPTPEVLELKLGAQVMMLNNDTDKRWVNGTLGKIIEIIADEGDDVVMVELENGSQVDVKKHTWEIYQYYFDEVNNSLGAKVVGYFTQYPLKLAWAVTIHKSQGQTFERVVIDVGFGTFAHGQMYVALSRCTSLEGIVLKQPLNQRHILMDQRVLRFMKQFMFTGFMILVSSWAWAQTPNQDRTQAVSQSLSTIEDKQVNPTAWEDKNSDKPYIGLLSETDTVVHDDGSVTQDYHARVKIQKEAAKNIGQWPVYYDQAREKITDIEAFIETADGKKLEATDVRDLAAYDQSPMYSDMRFKVITFPQITIGTIIDVHVKSRVVKEKISGQFWDEITYPAIPTKYSRFSYVFPANLTVHYSSYNNDKRPSIEKANGVIKYSYIFEDTDYDANEPFMPPPDEVIGVLSLSTMGDWKDVADWWRSELKKNIIDDPDISAKAHDLVIGKTDTKDKLRAIMEYIQDKFRYVPMIMGDHTIDLHSTAQVFKSGYGDCKDLAVLAKQMLKAVGIDSNLCLFSGEFNGDPQHRSPNPSIFDRVILEVQLDGQKYFVDPETKGFDLGKFPSSYDNAYVMVIGDNSYEFTNLPVADGPFHSVNTVSDINVSDEGSADFHVNVTMPVEASEDFKSSWDKENDSSKTKFFENLQATFGQNGKITDQNVKGLDQRYGPVVFDFKYSASKIYQIANDMILLKEQEQGDVPDFSEDTRHYPIFVPSNSLIINSNTYHVPENLKISFVPPDFDLSTDFMEVSVKYTKTGDAVTIESTYHLKRALIPPQGFLDVKKFREELDQKNDQYVILKSKTNAASETKTWLKNQ